MQFNFPPRKTDDFIRKITTISLGKRVCIYLLAMGALGAFVGAVDSRVTSQKCLDGDDCSIEELTEPGMMRIGIGAFAGAIAAGLISLPAMLDDAQDRQG